MDVLYSGVAKSTASALAIAAFKRATLSGRGWTSSSSSYGGTLLEAVVELELDVWAGGLGRGAQQARVVRVAAEAAGDAQDPRR
jgi:hypothetical protein